MNERVVVYCGLVCVVRYGAVMFLCGCQVSRALCDE